ncbi:MAG: hypothetical protein LC659_09460 [Myxococcales bacterium]|nr:hypothetical protein [Myxococcales bacterium]
MLFCDESPDTANDRATSEIAKRKSACARRSREDAMITRNRAKIAARIGAVAQCCVLRIDEEQRRVRPPGGVDFGARRPHAALDPLHQACPGQRWVAVGSEHGTRLALGQTHEDHRCADTRYGVGRVRKRSSDLRRRPVLR